MRSQDENAPACFNVGGVWNLQATTAFLFISALWYQSRRRGRGSDGKKRGKRILMKDAVNLKLAHFLRLIADAVGASASEIKLTWFILRLCLHCYVVTPRDIQAVHAAAVEQLGLNFSWVRWRQDAAASRLAQTGHQTPHRSIWWRGHAFY